MIFNPSDLINIKYPRRSFIRKLLKYLGKIITHLFFKVDIIGKGNFPKNGPLIVVGNHSAVMEAVLMMIYAPWEIEMLGAADIPHEIFNQVVSDLYGFIPLNRGNVDRTALKAALNILKQRGVIGLFPEGGIWEPGLMRAQTGVAWISYRSNTPVLPIGFSGTLGAIDKALRFKRPKLTMNIGDIIPPLKLEPKVPRKKAFRIYSDKVMSQVRSLLLPGDSSLDVKIKNEQFELLIQLFNDLGHMKTIPEDLEIKHRKNLAKFLHRPAILKIFRSNLKLPIEVLENLEECDTPHKITEAVTLIINYIQQENPYILTYRFGAKISEDMLLGLLELKELTQWAESQGLAIKIIPIRKFFSILDDKEITQTTQKSFNVWM